MDDAEGNKYFRDQKSKYDYKNNIKEFKSYELDIRDISS